MADQVVAGLLAQATKGDDFADDAKKNGTGSFSLTIQESPIARAEKLDLKDGMVRVEAKLAKMDAMDAVQTRPVCKIYAIQLAKGKSYQIDMMSKDIDSFLRLENSSAKELAKDDDSGGGRNARIQSIATKMEYTASSPPRFSAARAPSR